MAALTKYLEPVIFNSRKVFLDFWRLRSEIKALAGMPAREKLFFVFYLWELGCRVGCGHLGIC